VKSLKILLPSEYQTYTEWWHTYHSC